MKPASGTSTRYGSIGAGKAFAARFLNLHATAGFLFLALAVLHALRYRFVDRVLAAMPLGDECPA